jgi:2-(1,2-epoxy-1,2-dihydrophenyl)acetyl-CoA isomerase
MFVGIGLVIDAGSSFFLPRAVGSFRAFELASTGRKITAKECLELGLATQVVAKDDLEKEVLSLASKYAAGPTLAIGLIKHMLNQSSHSDLASMLALETDCQEKASRTHDFMEGATAFLEKRTPLFKGK